MPKGTNKSEETTPTSSNPDLEKEKPSSASIAQKTDPDIQPIFSLLTDLQNKRKRKRGKSCIELEAIDVLKEIPDMVNRKKAITSWLQVAREVKVDEEIYEFILKYINNGQRHCYGIQVLNILQIVRADDLDYEKGAAWQSKQRLLLWHGTSEGKIASILQNGFQIPPSNNQMFGPGIYFADRASKSANYCENQINRQRILEEGTKQSNYYLLLCDVLIGEQFTALSHNHSITAAPGDCDSVIGVGKNIPDPSESKYYQKMLIPLGKTIKNELRSLCELEHNEYVVYSPEKAKPLYLIKFEFVAAPVYNYIG